MIVTERKRSGTCGVFSTRANVSTDKENFDLRIGNSKDDTGVYTIKGVFPISTAIDTIGIQMDFFKTHIFFGLTGVNVVSK